jgi:hypothetical protein
VVTIGTTGVPVGSLAADDPTHLRKKPAASPEKAAAKGAKVDARGVKAAAGRIGANGAGAAVAARDRVTANISNISAPGARTRSRATARRPRHATSTAAMDAMRPIGSQ